VLAHGPTAAAKPSEPLERALVVAAGALVAALLAACGVVLVVRRVGGGFEPVGGAASLVVAVFGGLLVLGCDALARGAGLSTAWRHAARAGYLLALAAIAVPLRATWGLETALLVALGDAHGAAEWLDPTLRALPQVADVAALLQKAWSAQTGGAVEPLATPASGPPAQANPQGLQPSMG
jgi:hypothetical protein